MRFLKASALRAKVTRVAYMCACFAAAFLVCLVARPSFADGTTGSGGVTQTPPDTGLFLDYGALANQGKGILTQSVQGYSPTIVSLMIGLVALSLLFGWMTRLPKKAAG